MTLLFTGAIFVSAALLFLVQPMVARMVLPRLGGSPEVWNTSLVFFQAALLAGYAWAHWSVGWLGLRRQAAVHALVLLLPFLVLPMALPGWEAPRGWQSPWLLGLLAVSVGAPFFALATASPLLQRWFVASGSPGAEDPYWLYAASNAGSLLGLLAYPFLVEPFLPLDAQARVWSWGYAVAALLVGAGMLLGVRGGAGNVADASGAAGPAPPWRRRLFWVACAAVPSALLLAVTHHLTMDVAPVPLLWVLPLAVYLSTYIAAFARRPPVGARRLSRWMAVAALAMVLVFVGRVDDPVWLMVVVHLAVLAVAGLLCHVRLADTRPEPSRLTEFYLFASLGGVVGGATVALVAPVVFQSLVEYPLVLALACFLRAPDADRPRRRLRLGFAAAMTMLLPVAFFLGHASEEVLHRERTFFGVHTVERDPDDQYRVLRHGATVHGVQSREPGRSATPLGYYHPTGPGGEVMAAMAADTSARRVAVVGLGTGALAALAAPHQRLTLYEIDPAVVAIARDSGHFTYLERTPAAWEVVVGDGRIRLAQTPETFDLIVLDAFSSATVPVHLLTREAMELYLERLRPGGVVLAHVSNQHLDLAPVLGAVATDLGAAARRRVDTRPDLPEGVFGSVWVAVARDPAHLDRYTGPGWMPLASEPGVPAWTDGFSNVLTAYRVQ